MSLPERVFVPTEYEMAKEFGLIKVQTTVNNALIAVGRILQRSNGMMTVGDLMSIVANVKPHRHCKSNTQSFVYT